MITPDGALGIHRWTAGPPSGKVGKTERHTNANRTQEALADVQTGHTGAHRRKPLFRVGGREDCMEMVSLILGFLDKQEFTTMTSTRKALGRK